MRSTQILTAKLLLVLCVLAWPVDLSEAKKLSGDYLSIDPFDDSSKLFGSQLASEQREQARDEEATKFAAYLLANSDEIAPSNSGDFWPGEQTGPDQQHFYRVARVGGPLLSNADSNWWDQLESLDEEQQLSRQLNSRELSPPVNEPLADEPSESESESQQEAALSQLTGRLNSELPNTYNRTRWLLDLIDEQTKDLATQPAEDGLRRLVQHMEQMRAARLQHDQEKQLVDGAQQQADATTRPSGRYGASEYIDHPLALSGHQYVQGGAGEGHQLLGPEGTFENVQVVKSDSAVPAYCAPPNPCPLGYSAQDGCMENFVNSASFSREYQAKQDCACDNEHSLLNCESAHSSPSQEQLPSTTESASNVTGDNREQQAMLNENKLDVLARTLQYRFGDFANVHQIIQQHQQEMERHAAATGDKLSRSTRKWTQPLGALVNVNDNKLVAQLD